MKAVKVNIKAEKIKDGTLVNHRTEFYRNNAFLNKLTEALFSGEIIKFKKDKVTLTEISFQR